MTDIAATWRQFDQDPNDLANQQAIIDFVRNSADATEIVQRLVNGCTSLLDESGQYAVMNTVYDAGQVDDIRGAKMKEMPDPLEGKIFSEHLYLAAKCISQAKEINSAVVDQVIKLLLSEFDRELMHPRGAIRAFGQIGNIAITHLMKYLKDSNKETFTREDAAESLGRIGTDEVVAVLNEYLFDPTSDERDVAMAFYALGHTHNPKARPIIIDFMNEHPSHPRKWVAMNALERIP